MKKNRKKIIIASLVLCFQSCGFGGLWRFAGPFTKANNNAENVELFNNALEALVETCLPVDDVEEARSVF
jgi:hypothetical protein